MDYRSYRRLGKFYREQVTTIVGLLEHHFRSQTKKFEEYLIVCERLGKTPNLAKIPMDRNYYPFEVQLAMAIHEVLPDRWDGMSGSYLGKDWSALGDILEIMEIEDKKTVCFFLKHVENAQMVNINDELKRKRDADQRRAKAGR